MTLSTPRIDSAKSTFSLHGADHAGKEVFRRRLTRYELPAYVANLPTYSIISIPLCYMDDLRHPHAMGWDRLRSLSPTNFLGSSLWLRRTRLKRPIAAAPSRFACRYTSTTSPS